MPLTRIALRRGKPAHYRGAILNGVYAAMRETFDVPDDDRFMLVTQHDADEFLYGRHYLGIDRSDDLVIIQLTVSNTAASRRSRRCTGASSKSLGTIPACGRRTSSSIWSRWRRRTGRSGTARRNTRDSLLAQAETPPRHCRDTSTTLFCPHNRRALTERWGAT